MQVPPSPLDASANCAITSTRACKRKRAQTATAKCADWPSTSSQATVQMSDASANSVSTTTKPTTCMPPRTMGHQSQRLPKPKPKSKGHQTQKLPKPKATKAKSCQNQRLTKNAQIIFLPNNKHARIICLPNNKHVRLIFLPNNKHVHIIFLPNKECCWGRQVQLQRRQIPKLPKTKGHQSQKLPEPKAATSQSF